jgi:hypothetical protein
MSDPDRAFDVLVIDATGEYTSQAHALRRELVARGLRVKLDVIPLPTNSPPPADMLKDASDARYCVLLMPTKDGKVNFMAFPAPTKPCQLPVFGKPGSAEVLGAIEMGTWMETLGRLRIE